MVQIWGRMSSLNVRKVVWAAQETGVPFTRTDAGLAFGIVKTPEYLRLNPNAQVPTLQDGELVLWESNVIVRYLCARHAPALYPQELAARFDAERWMDWQQTSLNPAGSPAFIQLFRTPQDKRDPAVISKSVASMTPLLTLLEQHLSQREYMAGDSFSMADIPVACDIHRWFALPQTRPALLHLERWYARVLARPATRGVLDLPLA
jgi:glutathione S-transferase